MAYPKNKQSALLALLAAGGAWAWQNRDKVSAWASQIGGQISTARAGQPSYRKVLSEQQAAPAVEAYTGNTRRIGDEANEI